MAKSIEYWLNLTKQQDPREGLKQVVEYEADGWDGAVLFDSQCYMTEVWAYLSHCVSVTGSIKIATGVTNPVTRHPSVTASTASTLQLLSGGRIVLGVGRGDSALAFIGAAPMRMSRFESSIEVLQTYLRGERVPMSESASYLVGVDSIHQNLAGGVMPEGSCLEWLNKFDMPKVPLEVYATGQQVIEAGARTAERVMFALGADYERLSWGIELAKKAAGEAGRQADLPGFGANILIFPHSDISVAREMIKGVVAGHARFGIMNKKIVGPATPHQRKILEELAANYDMNDHGKSGAQTAILDDEFVDKFAVVGTPDQCIERIKSLTPLGLSRITFITPISGNNEELQLSYNLLAKEVLPGLR